MWPRIFSVRAFEIPGSPIGLTILLVGLALVALVWFAALWMRKRSASGARAIEYAAYAAAAVLIAAFLLPGRRLGPFTLHTYGLTLAVAFLVGLWIVARRARKEGLEVARMTDLSIFMLIAGLIGAKLFMVIVEWRHFSRHFQWRDIWSLLQSGGVFYGGLLVALPVAWWYMRKHGLPTWKALDVLAQGLVLGQAIGRLGCFSAGCCYGRGFQGAWAVTFRDIEAWRTLGTPLDTPLHPTQLYESAAALLIFFLLVWLAPRKRFHGQIALVYLLAYSSARFVVEFFRGDSGRGLLFGNALSTAQVVGIVIVVVTLAIMPYLAKTQRVTTPGA
ncbi:MAG: prolipoprotein diacylglyceryl transferase [Vicinamibacteria bacterium]|nr:prolipoprotein diacylglyceryl transferase [Vicinamibacteria bacterium]